MTDFIWQASTILSGLIFGGMIFFAVFMTPLIFIKLPQNVSGNFIREVFPWYYLLFGMLSLVLAILLIPHNILWMTVVASMCAVVFLYARQWLMPKINTYRDLSLSGDNDAAIKFKKLHRVSVALNSMQLLGIFIVYYNLIG